MAQENYIFYYGGPDQDQWYRRFQQIVNDVRGQIDGIANRSGRNIAMDQPVYQLYALPDHISRDVVIDAQNPWAVLTDGNAIVVDQSSGVKMLAVLNNFNDWKGDIERGGNFGITFENQLRRY